MNPKISVHHIGGRNGFGAFPDLPSFDADLITVLYDADPACAEQMRQVNRGRSSEVHVLPYCVGQRNEPCSLHINYDPYTSSLLESNPGYASFYSVQGDVDYVWGDSSRAMEVPCLDCLALDGIFRDGAAVAPPPDFLSIDTQGSEYQILCGAEGLLDRDVLALVVEVEFHPIYKDQRLFGDLCRLLDRHGFYFVRFAGFFEMAPHRAPIGLRGAGFQVSSDAVFLKKHSAVTGRADPPDEVQLKLLKLAFLSVVFGQVEYAVQCLTLPEVTGRVGPWASCEGPTYLEFLEKFAAVIGEPGGTFLRTFSEKYSYAESKARFTVPPPDSPSPEPTAGHAKSALRRLSPRLYQGLRAVWHSRGVRGVRRLGRGGGGARGSRTRPSKAEALFLEYGLEEQASLLRENRLRHSGGFGR